MRILISNDDGIYSPGIAALAKVAARFGEVRIVAPDVEMSSAGQSITSSRPLTYKHTPIGPYEGFRVNGTPADCVALGVYNWEKVDVVLSGINLGHNLGNSMWHSGTLAAAKQAVLLGLRGIALSAPADDEPKFDTIEPWVEKVLALLLPDEEWKLINVNFPKGQPKDMRWARQSVRYYDGKVIPGRHPLGWSYFWFTVTPMQAPDEGTDRWCVEHGYVSLTPLRLDLTNESELEKAQARHALG
ncbi:MAG TPA: 5'/3'-nucleotidase SurE [Gemmataceae bacterium]|nr:5'/3'-nucleotidase SurE [Gemmataceae bacterium]